MPVFELEVTEGLEELAGHEVADRLNVSSPAIAVGRGWLRFNSTARPSRVAELQLTESAFQVLTFPVPRPKALLGDAHFRQLRTGIADIIRGFPAPPASFYVSAAGAESSVMLRLRNELSRALGLADGMDEGDVQLRLLRSREIDGWDVLIRLTTRPLATRAWRVCSFPGALNATVARAMVVLTQPRPTDVFVNLLSGSGSLLIERCLALPTRHAIGVEIAAEHVACAERNVAAAGLQHQITLSQADAMQLPIADASATALAADLPFGQRIGRHEDNLRLYPAILREATRIAQVRARFAVITHEVNLIERLLNDQPWWDVESKLRLTLRGLHPRLYVLQRNEVSSRSHNAW